MAFDKTNMRNVNFYISDSDDSYDSFSVETDLISQKRPKKQRRVTFAEIPMIHEFEADEDKIEEPVSEEQVKVTEVSKDCLGLSIGIWVLILFTLVILGTLGVLYYEMTVSAIEKLKKRMN